MTGDASVQIGVMAYPAGLVGSFMGFVVERDRIEPALRDRLDIDVLSPDQGHIGLIAFQSRDIFDDLDQFLLFGIVAAGTVDGAGIRILGHLGLMAVDAVQMGGGPV